MTYRPAETSFGPPVVALLPTIIYLMLALTAIGVVVAAHVGPRGSSLHAWIVEQDPRRVISSRTFAALIAASAFSVLLRASMRGVRIRADGVEYRDVLALGPQARVRVERVREPELRRRVGRVDLGRVRRPRVHIAVLRVLFPGLVQEDARRRQTRLVVGQERERLLLPPRVVGHGEQHAERLRPVEQERLVGGVRQRPVAEVFVKRVGS